MVNRSKYFLGTIKSRNDLGAVLMTIGLFLLMLPILFAFATEGESSLTFSITVGFIGLSFFVSGSILVASIPIIENDK